MNRLSRDEVKKRVEKIRQGIGSDHEVGVWIEEILASVPNREVIKTIMAGENVSIDEIVDRLYTADVIYNFNPSSVGYMKYNILKET